MRSHHHQEIREPFGQNAEEGDRSVGPFVLQRDAADASDIDPIGGAGDGVEAGGINDHVKLLLARRSADAVRRDALDRRLVEVDERDIGLIALLASPAPRPSLVEPQILETPAIVEAVLHDRDPLDARMPAGRRAIMR